MTGVRGSMTVAMSGALAIVATAAVAVAAVGALYAAKTQAETAADAGALAAAVATYPGASTMSPSAAARLAAAANGALVEGCSCPLNAELVPRTVEVVTWVDARVPLFGALRVRAVGRAEFDPSQWLGGDG